MGELFQLPITPRMKIQNIDKPRCLNGTKTYVSMAAEFFSQPCYYLPCLFLCLGEHLDICGLCRDQGKALDQGPGDRGHEHSSFG